MQSVRISHMAKCTRCNIIYMYLYNVFWVFPISPTNITDRHDITEILYKVSLNLLLYSSFICQYIFLVVNCYS